MKYTKKKKEELVGRIMAGVVVVFSLVIGYVFIMGGEGTPLLAMTGNVNDLGAMEREVMIDELNNKYAEMPYAFFLGDSTEGNDEKKWTDLHEGFVSKINADTLFVPGDRDYQLFESDNQDLKDKFFTGEPKKLVVEKDGKSFLLLLVSTIPQNPEFIDEGDSKKIKTAFDSETENFLVSNLKESPAYDYVFILMHHNMWIFDLYLNYPNLYQQNAEGFKGVGYEVFPNSWFSAIVPNIDINKTFVISGDAEKTLQINYRGIQYFATGMPSSREDSSGYLVVKIKDGKPRFYEKVIGGRENFIDYPTK